MALRARGEHTRSVAQASCARLRWLLEVVLSSIWRFQIFGGFSRYVILRSLGSRDDFWQYGGAGHTDA